jgi:putative nucleotidyltransferase with HDIG domain
MALYNILFVDDDISVLDGLRRIFYSMHDRWNITYCSSAVDAIAKIRCSHYDVVISDLRMPEMDGICLLEQVKAISPDTVRFMLSGYNDEELVARSTKCAHQFLSKPCDSNILKDKIAQALALDKRRISDEIKKTISSLNSLSAMPGVYHQLMQMISSPSVSARDIGRLIASDVGMSAKILQIVNSAFYGIRSKVADPVHAVIYLGLNTIKGLVLLYNVFSKIDQSQVERFKIDHIQTHCMEVAGLCHKIFSIIPSKDFNIEDVTTAGLMHDIGKIILAQIKPDDYEIIYADALSGDKPVWQAEFEAIGMTHGDVGGYLLELWGLSPGIIEAVTCHNTPDDCQNRKFSPLTIVYLANEFSKRISENMPLPEDVESCNSEYLISLKMEQQLGSLFKTLEQEYGLSSANA